MSDESIDEYPIVLNLKKSIKIATRLVHSQTIVYHCREIPVVKSNGKTYYKLVTSDGEVAILYSPSVGVGWSTSVRTDVSFENREQLIKDSELIKLVFTSNYKDNFSSISHEPSNTFKKYIENLLDDWRKEKMPSCLGTYNLKVEFIPEKTQFRINSCDGAESIEIYNPDKYFTA
jgi:hypothetical protein